MISHPPPFPVPLLSHHTPPSTQDAPVTLNLTQYPGRAVLSLSPPILLMLLLLPRGSFPSFLGWLTSGHFFHTSWSATSLGSLSWSLAPHFLCSQTALWISVLQQLLHLLIWLTLPLDYEQPESRGLHYPSQLRQCRDKCSVHAWWMDAGINRILPPYTPGWHNKQLYYDFKPTTLTQSVSLTCLSNNCVVETG